ncbi:MAG: aminotransferase class V-fold PLP-dependent enzyme [Planctomycetota bacterium]|nr:aminotransferase class V-fold PLP-dependent enzyme [Planctomycetota bacterium]
MNDSSSAPERLYLDNAATSFPKPAAVHEAMLAYATTIGATPGRANYAESRQGGRLIQQCRERLCRLFNVPHPDRPEQVIFTLNTTDALNLAIKGLARHIQRATPGRRIHMISTQADHNSVLRPLNALRADGIEWTCIPVAPRSWRINPEDVARALTPDTALVVMNHASNVTGVIQPAADVGAICGRAGVPFLLDIAQSGGHIGVDVKSLHVDLLAFPGHKGLLGPLGTGGLWIRPGLEARIAPLREGGTGTSSDIDVQPEFLPDKYEPGSHNAVGIAGLSEAIAYLLQHGTDLFTHEQELIARFLRGLAERGCQTIDNAARADGPLQSLRLLGPMSERGRIGVFTFVHTSLTPRELADQLETRFGVLCRPGVHCAPRMHSALGTLDGDPAHRGGLRLSLGPFVTAADVDRTLDALTAVCATSAPRSADVASTLT